MKHNTLIIERLVNCYVLKSEQTSLLKPATTVGILSFSNIEDVYHTRCIENACQCQQPSNNPASIIVREEAVLLAENARKNFKAAKIGMLVRLAEEDANAVK